MDCQILSVLSMVEIEYELDISIYKISKGYIGNSITCSCIKRTRSSKDNVP